MYRKSLLTSSRRSRRLPRFEEISVWLLKRQSPQNPRNSPRIDLLIAVKEPIVSMYIYSRQNERPAPSRRCIYDSGGQEEVACWNSWLMNRSSSDSKRAERFASCS